MTQLLEQALTEIKKLPEPEQDAIASLILDELADEECWQESFARSQDQLTRLAAKVREDIRAGLVKAGGFDHMRERVSPAP
jgi:cytochrome c-type biogenesis protein CcmH/NrfF